VRRPLPPLWIWLLGAALCSAVAVLSYSHFVGLLGWSVWRIETSNGDAVWAVRVVRADTPVARAGIRVGDSIRGADMARLMRVIRPGGKYQIPVGSPSGPRIATLQLDPRDLAYWRSAEGLRSLFAMASALLALALAAAIVLTKPHDSLARWGALFLAQLAVFLTFGVPLGPAPERFALIDRFPFPLDAMATAGWWSCALTPAVMLTFLGRFPHKPFAGRLLAILWLPTVVIIPLEVLFWQLIHPGARGPSMPPWVIASASAIGVAYILVAVALLLRNYRRLKDANERRRTKTVVIGLAITAIIGVLHVVTGIVAVLHMLRIMPWQPVERLRLPQMQWLLWAWPILFSAAPICTAYAILRHRMFDISVMVRLGLRYAVARGLLLSLVPLIGLALLADVLLHGSEPLAEVLYQRGWRYAVLALGAYLLHARQKTWLAAVDRRFFREHYDAQQILAAVVEEVHRGAGFEPVAPLVITRVDSALHPEFASLVLREPGAAGFRTVASSGNAPAPPAAEGKLLSLVRVLGKPVEVPLGQSDWLARQLPPEESDFVRRGRIEWLFPVSLEVGGSEALLLLGPKRSEEPYSKEDENLLEAIAASLAILLARSAPVVPPKTGFEGCPACGYCYEPGTGLCGRDGAVLSRLVASRAIARRYRLDRRLGQGGMGTVYEAFDGELERRVAVKLIRPELVAGVDAAARFKWEAKAAAAFTHPNVVTVHDFGVAEDGRAYTVMELLEGCTLRQELDGGTRLEARRALAVMRGMCAAASAAHQRGLLHRDLKPENIFLCRSGGEESAKILDFGLVKQLPGFGKGQSDSLATTAGVLVGTLKYMPPEQLRGASPAPSWDLWALAIVAYEMLVGAYPFTQPRELTDLIDPRALESVRQRHAEAPAAWQEFFESALSSDPAGGRPPLKGSWRASKGPSGETSFDAPEGGQRAHPGRSVLASLYGFAPADW
jgi:hypothetical protein